MANGHGAQGNALGLKVFHDRVKAFVLFAQQVMVWNAHVVEHQLGGVGRQPTCFLECAAHTETRCAFFNNEHRHGVACIARFGGNEIQIGMHAVGDEHLGAIEHPVIAIAFGRGANARHVRSGTRL